GYDAFVGDLVGALSPPTRSRLSWTSHVYVAKDKSKLDLPRATDKLERDVAIAQKLGLPFYVGEIGEIVRDAPAHCTDGAAHDLTPVFAAVFEKNALLQQIEGAVFWGEGQCRLSLGGRSVDVGVGGDGADLGPNDPGRAQVVEERKRARFQ